MMIMREKKKVTEGWVWHANNAGEKDRKRQWLYSQSDTHFCFITRLSDKPLYLFIGFPRQKNTVPLQDLHSYTQSHICTQPYTSAHKKTIKKYSRLKDPIHNTNISPQTKPKSKPWSDSLFKWLKGSIHCKNELMLTWPVQGLPSILWLNSQQEKTSFDSRTQTSCASDCRPELGR